MVKIDGVESVDEVVTDDVADLRFDVIGVAVDEVGGAVGAEGGFVLAQVGSGDDVAEASEGAGLDGVFATVAAGADNDNGFFAEVEERGVLLGVTIVFL